MFCAVSKTITVMEVTYCHQSLRIYLSPFNFYTIIKDFGDGNVLEKEEEDEFDLETVHMFLNSHMLR